MLVVGLQLPAAPPPAPEPGQSGPAPVAAPAARELWEASWSLTVGSTTSLHVAVSRDHVFTAGPESPLVAREADTGDIAWTHELTGWQALTATSSLVLGIAGDHAYALDAATGQTRWITQTTGSDTQLVVAGDRLLMVSRGDALLRDAVTGAPLGHVGLDAPPSAAPALSPDAAVVGLADGRVVAFDVPAGLQLWEARLRRPAATLTATRQSVFAALPEGTLLALDARTGSVRWQFPIRVPIVGAPFVDEESVYVVLLDNSLRAFDRRSGAMRRTEGLGHRPAAGPWVTGSAAVIGLTTGEFLVLDPASGRRLTRLAPPAGTTSVLESAALGPETFWLASLTIVPGGERHLSAYRHYPAATVTTEEVVSGPRVPDAEGAQDDPTRDDDRPVPPGEPEPPAEPAPEAPEAPLPVPRPFPLPE